MRMMVDGEVAEFSVPQELLSLVSGMIADPWEYFLTTNDTQLIDVERLVLSRARPTGIENAVALMKSAAEGVHPKRGPISVRPIGDLFLVVDGNSTLVASKAIGMTKVPVHLVASEGP